MPNQGDILHIQFCKNPVFWDGNFERNSHPSIGAPLGYVVVTTLKDKHGIKAKTRHLPVEGLQLVSIRRLDGYVVERIGGELLLHQEGLKKEVIPLDPPFEHHYWHFMISHKFYDGFPQLAETIWDQIKIQRNNNLKTLMNEFMEKLTSPTKAKENQ